MKSMMPSSTSLDDSAKFLLLARTRPGECAHAHDLKSVNEADPSNESFIVNRLYAK